jgi:hypothetical protein
MIAKDLLECPDMVLDTLRSDGELEEIRHE